MKLFCLPTSILALLGYLPGAIAQTDTPETLQWVEAQAGKIDSLLGNAIASHEHVNLMMRLTDAYLLFDAVALAAVYCPEIREAAHQGHKLTDVVNYRLEKDLNNSVLRATLARAQAEKMRLSANKCRSESAPGAAGLSFSPADVLRAEAVQVDLLLSDGLAVGDFHVLSQKLEQSIRILHEVEHLAASFDSCSQPADAAARAILACEAALGARNWTQVHQAVKTALLEVKTISNAACR